MRTKTCEGVYHLSVTNLTPPEAYLVYDGLAGLTLRPILHDVMEGLYAQGTLSQFAEATRRRRWANLYVYFRDYASYGVGGGDVTAEFYFGQFLLLHCPAAGVEPEHLWLQGHGKNERLSLEGGGT